MNAQHTPGPWKWLGTNLEGPQNTDVIAASVACGQWCQGGSVDLTMSDADKALIEAAPDLLKAARIAVTALAHITNSSPHDEAFYGPAYRALDGAIAKATGSAA